MRRRQYVVEVSNCVAASGQAVWALVADPRNWRQFSGATLSYRVVQRHRNEVLEYVVESGLPTRDHTGRIELRARSANSTEIVWVERFRPRTIGTGGFLRARIETHLVASTRHVAAAAASDGADQARNP